MIQNIFSNRTGWVYKMIYIIILLTLVIVIGGAAHVWIVHQIREAYTAEVLELNQKLDSYIEERGRLLNNIDELVSVNRAMVREINKNG